MTNIKTHGLIPKDIQVHFLPDYGTLFDQDESLEGYRDFHIVHVTGFQSGHSSTMIAATYKQPN